ncbi:unnamed protein product, partial [Mesorhabditis spiculigera]
QHLRLGFKHKEQIRVTSPTIEDGLVYIIAGFGFVITQLLILLALLFLRASCAPKSQTVELVSYEKSYGPRESAGADAVAAGPPGYRRHETLLWEANTVFVDEKDGRVRISAHGYFGNALKPGDRVLGVKTYYDREGFLSLPYLVSYESQNEPPNAAETASSLARLLRKIARGCCVACSSPDLKHNRGILRCCRRCADKIERWSGEKNRCPTQGQDSARLSDPSADLLGGCTECLARRLHSFGFVLPAHIAAILHIYPKKKLLGGAICKHQRYSLLPLF